jgi:hypothetical protein
MTASDDSGGGHDVFVSYATPDAAVAGAIVTELERNGINLLSCRRNGAGSLT